MTFSLDQIVPWGRSFDEYSAMFNLSAKDLDGSFLDVGGGPASFNAELTERGGRAVSVDPLYGFDAKAIQQRVDACFDDVLHQTSVNHTKFVWKTFASIDQLADTRRAAMDRFIVDYTSDNSRYIEGALPSLGFEDNQFDLALCSHLLFLYSDHLDLEFHRRSILELCRVANEVRIFPLIDLDACSSEHLPPICSDLEDRGLSLKIETTDYEFQKGGCEMLRIQSPAV